MFTGNSQKSYHDQIQKLARGIENLRGKDYQSKGTIVFNENELQFLSGAIYKLLRLKNRCTNIHKGRDDVIDAYNFLALLFEEFSRRFSCQEATKQSGPLSKENIEGSSRDGLGSGSQELQDPLVCTISSHGGSRLTEEESSDLFRSKKEGSQPRKKGELPMIPYPRQ